MSARKKQAGMSREDAYQSVQKNAMHVWELKDNERSGAFQRFLINDPEVTNHLGTKEIENLFDLAHHTKYTNLIFSRVFD